jgi:hypothetical protein
MPRSPASLTVPTLKPFERDDGFDNLGVILSQFGEHLRDVHAERIARLVGPILPSHQQPCGGVDRQARSHISLPSGSVSDRRAVRR